MKNYTKNQHYLSQAEQRLNAVNPCAGNKKQKIYGFEVSGDGQLGCPKLLKIESTLSDLDLYSFSILEDKARLNFESEFGRYESEIESWVASLNSKVKNGFSDVAEEVQHIFVLKFLNTLRNPFTIKETLQIFKKYSNYYPTNVELREIYSKIDTEVKPHMSTICERYGVMDSEYLAWLKILYLLLYVRDNEGSNLLESVVKSFYENAVHHIQVFVCRYSREQSVLLSDKGFNKFDSSESCINYEFNLDYKSHIAFAFTDVTAALPDHPLHGNERIIELFKSMPQQINLRVEVDNEELLSAYNIRTVTQASGMVFCKFNTKPKLGS
ncbi:conserved hypothetical protein [Vibrio crassostreae]|uniref:hypothetical protein n=1 Tax=Vibrio TaxID=662 RepID=UPI000CCA3DF3|nr:MULTISPECIES: hypothetical protein [Vibrio]PMN50476.1 hypothetical protein BCT31_20810 [Vibrio lentus]CAK1722267.1 conserved hypothetical protein [Vibrio crassostreae]CAK1953209.1 conserved hypothetical protein [Vibrio crassostreae]CAK1990932.1 conserved hypothetical protein [Vibrio crassostreae]CAK2044886.1 conserved hypothetical protein [Vibrio crassostreae]